jgi:hypothetical protein
MITDERSASLASTFSAGSLAGMLVNACADFRCSNSRSGPHLVGAVRNSPDRTLRRESKQSNRRVLLATWRRI